MKMKNFLMILTMLTGSAFAQERIHPDLNVPKVDFSEFDRHQQSVKDELEKIDFNQQGKVDALSVTIPDYKVAYQAYAQSVSAITAAYDAALIKLKNDAINGVANLAKLQAQYSSRLFALEAAIKKYPDSADTFTQSYHLEHGRMTVDVQAKYHELLQNLQVNYTAALNQALGFSGVSGLDHRNPNAFDRAAIITTTPFFAVASLALWVMPAPLPVFFSPNGWCKGKSFIANPDSIYRHDPDCDKTFWGILQKAHYSLLVTPKKESYDKALYLFSQSLFVNCKTAACAYEISKDYKRFLLNMAEINVDIQVGPQTLKAGKKIKTKNIVKLLKDATKMAAEARPTAIFVPN
jgi:hypothetical protein